MQTIYLRKRTVYRSKHKIYILSKDQFIYQINTFFFQEISLEMVESSSRRICVFLSYVNVRTKTHNLFLKMSNIFRIKC